MTLGGRNPQPCSTGEVPGAGSDNDSWCEVADPELGCGLGRCGSSCSGSSTVPALAPVGTSLSCFLQAARRGSAHCLSSPYPAPGQALCSVSWLTPSQCSGDLCNPEGTPGAPACPHCSIVELGRLTSLGLASAGGLGPGVGSVALTGLPSASASQGLGHIQSPAHRLR
ncbi:hypothetical protein AAY473_004561 [Plecturocebus cupreus]